MIERHILISVMVILSNLNLLLTLTLRGNTEQKHKEVMVFTQQKTVGFEGGVKGGFWHLHAL